MRSGPATRDRIIVGGRHCANDDGVWIDPIEGFKHEAVLLQRAGKLREAEVCAALQCATFAAGAHMMRT